MVESSLELLCYVLSVEYRFHSWFSFISRKLFFSLRLLALHESGYDFLHITSFDRPEPQ